MNHQLIKQKLTENNICIVIPTYNNSKTLTRVLDGVLTFTNDIIVVNDGSTDITSAILQNYSDRITIKHIEQNGGKGLALRTGFQMAATAGYDFAITIDSDGQHFPSDIPVFINELENSETKNVLYIGSRNMEQEGVPAKSSFGNKFSNFWFWFETGIKLEDTQSGYRLYPLHIIKNFHFFTTKFEFEIEVIVKAAWKGVEVKNVPVQVLYDENERVSHFRPFQDFTRISILNTWLVTIALLYIKPRDLIRSFKKKGVKQFILEDLLGSNDSPKKKALSIALGTFIGLCPLYGLHTVIVIFLAIFLKLNKTIAFAFSNVSIPPFMPFIFFASFKIGYWLLGSNFTLSLTQITEDFDILENVEAFIIGSFSLATIGAFLFGITSYVAFTLFGKNNVVLNNG